MTENDRKILTRACGLCWHEPEDILDEHNMPCVKCKVCGEVVYYLHFTDRPYCHENPTFTTADDWELVRVKVIVPHIEDFSNHLYRIGYDNIVINGEFVFVFTMSPIALCEVAADFIKARPDLFPWVGEMEEA